MTTSEFLTKNVNVFKTFFSEVYESDVESIDIFSADVVDPFIIIESRSNDRIIIVSFNEDIKELRIKIINSITNNISSWKVLCDLDSDLYDTLIFSMINQNIQL